MGRTTKRKADEHGDEDGNFAGQPGERAFAVSGARQKSARITKEYEEDAGRMDSQQFLELVQLGAKKRRTFKNLNEYLDNFKCQVDAESNRFKDSILELESMFRLSKFSDNFQLGCVSIIELEASLQRGSTLGQLEEKSRIALEHSSTLIKAFDQSALVLESRKISLGDSENLWNTDNSNMGNVLGAGAGIGVRKIASILEGQQASEDDTSTAQISALLFATDESVKAPGDETWGGIARRQGKLIKRMVDMLPRN